jgi:hypothetical protein
MDKTGRRLSHKSRLSRGRENLLGKALGVYAAAQELSAPVNSQELPRCQSTLEAIEYDVYTVVVSTKISYRLRRIAVSGTADQFFTVVRLAAKKIEAIEGCTAAPQASAGGFRFKCNDQTATLEIFFHHYVVIVLAIGRDIDTPALAQCVTVQAAMTSHNPTVHRNDVSGRIF